MNAKVQEMIDEFAQNDAIQMNDIQRAIDSRLEEILKEVTANASDS